MGMERVYIGESEPKGPFKPTLWIKNDTLEGLAIYIKVGNRYVKYKNGSDDETLYINAKFLPEEQQTENFKFTIDKTKKEIDDAIRHNKSVIFSIHVEENGSIAGIQCANFFVDTTDEHSNYIFEYTQFPMLSPTGFIYFGITFDSEGNLIGTTYDGDGIPEINVEDHGTALNYQKYGGGFLSVKVDGSTIGINADNELYVRNQ